MSVAMPKGCERRNDRTGRLAGAAIEQALGVVTGDRRLEAEGAAERDAERSAPSGFDEAEKRDAR